MTQPPSFLQVSDAARRSVLRAGFGAAAASLFGCAAPGVAPAGPTALGFAGVPVDRADRVVVPPGYAAEVIAPWGQPVGIAGALPAWRADAGNSAGVREFGGAAG